MQNISDILFQQVAANYPLIAAARTTFSICTRLVHSRIGSRPNTDTTPSLLTPQTSLLTARVSPAACPLDPETQQRIAKLQQEASALFHPRATAITIPAQKVCLQNTFEIHAQKMEKNAKKALEEHRSDDKYLELISSPDCGGLAHMSRQEEDQFKVNARNAVHWIAMNGGNPSCYQKHFERCFHRREFNEKV